MKNLILTGVVCLPLAGLAALPAAETVAPTATPAAPAPVQDAAAPSAGSYSVDAVHSSVMFRILHNRVANFYGRFNEVSGSFTWDGEDLSKAKVMLEIPTASVDTNDAKRDDHLKGPDFFNVRRYPKLTFKSTKVEGTPGALKVTGMLSLHGVEKEVTADAVFTGYAETQFGTRAGFEATFRIDRTEFGIEAYPDNLGAAVDVTIALEAVKD
ncbi:MAG: YceI family protein [Planctomycetota bacterium]|jgi:polyisoprenoid-binding protein YceI